MFSVDLLQVFNSFPADVIFRFFYSLYDQILKPQKKFICFSFSGKKDWPTILNEFKDICRLLHQSNDVVCPNPDDRTNLYLNQVEYRNFYFRDAGIDLISKQYLYPSFIRGNEGVVVCISCEKDIENTLTTTYQVSLSEIVRLAKCDDTESLPSNYYSLPFHIYPEKKKDFRPILFVIHSIQEKDLIARIKTIIETVIVEVGYEEHNTMVVVNSEEESNFYEGWEWLLHKRSD